MGLKRIVLELDFRRVAEIIVETIEGLPEAIRTRIEDLREAIRAKIEEFREAMQATIEAVQTAIEEYRIITRDNWRGWDENDIVSLVQKIDDNRSYHGGLLRLTDREYRALPELNRRVAAGREDVRTSPITIWVQDHGLFAAIRKH